MTTFAAILRDIFASWSYICS